MKNNPNYWEKRVADRVWKVYNSLEEKNRDLIEFYHEASRQIRMELYELAEQIGEDGIISRTEMYTQQRLQKLEKRYRDIAYELGQQVEQTEKENMQQGFLEVYENTLKQLEVPDFSIPNRKLMEKLMQEPWRGGYFSSRLWTNQKRLASAMNAILTTGLQQGKSVTNMAVELNMAMGKGFNEAHRLVRTETMHYLNSAVLQSYRDSGVKKVQFWAAEDERTCEICGAMHGKIYDIDKAPILPIHPNCRCTYLPVLDEEQMSARDNFNWPDPGQKISPNDYKDIQSYAKQKNIALSGFRTFDGNIGIIKEMVDAAEKIAKDFPKLIRKKTPLTIELDRYMAAEDFASTNGHIIRINADAFRDEEKLEKEYNRLVQEGWFVKGSSYRSIISHEVGHVVGNLYNIDSIQIAKELTGVKTKVELMEFIQKNLSEYAAAYEDGREIISECFSNAYGSLEKNEFALKFVENCGKLKS